MINVIKKLLALCLAAVMLLACAACGRSKEEVIIPESTGGKDVVRSAAADNVFSLNSNSKYSFDPFVATNHSNQIICCLVYENMLEVDNDFNVIPNVIKNWIPNEDGTFWEFEVEEGHYFHDGTEVTARDLSYSLQRAIYSDRYSGRFSSFQGSSFAGNKLQVTLGIGDRQFHKLLNIPVVKSGTAGKTGIRPTGSGPYTYNEEYTELHAYEGYPDYENLPVDTIYIKEYASAEEIISAFEDGSIDVVLNDPSSYTNLGYASTNETHTYATTNMHYVAFNEQSILGRFAYFRIAMEYAFDREYMVELLQGNAVASSVPMYPTASIYPQDLADSVTYNLEICRNILENAGIRDYDEDGKLEYMSGSPQDFSIKIVVTSDSAAKSGVVRRFAQDMEEIGIKVTVNELTWDEYMEALEKGDFDMYYGEVKLRNNFDLTELLQVHDASKDGQEGYVRPDINYTGSTDIMLEQYVKAYLGANDMNRASAYRTLCDYLLNTTGSLITIGFERQQIITHRGVVRGIEANAGNPLYNFQNWLIALDDETPVKTKDKDKDADEAEAEGEDEGQEAQVTEEDAPPTEDETGDTAVEPVDEEPPAEEPEVGEPDAGEPDAGEPEVGETDAGETPEEAPAEVSIDATA